MPKSTINLGSSPNDGTGSNLRTGGTIINNNFNEIYSNFGDGSNLKPYIDLKSLFISSQIMALFFNICAFTGITKMRNKKEMIKVKIFIN